MKKILTYIALSVGATACIYVLSLLATGDHYWCFKDHDTCVIEEANHYRDIRDQKLKDENDRHTQSVAAINTYYNDQKINPLKNTLSAGAMLREAKEGDKRNVPSEFFTLKDSLVPIAHADENSGDGWIKGDETTDQNSTTNSKSNTKPLRYQALLSSLNSPYANIDIESHCKQAGVEQAQCEILVAIAQSESTSGTNFKSNFLPTEQAIKLGQSFYHNPVGIKDMRPENERERNHPDENGMYLRRFSSWDEFWLWYPAHMKEAYFDRGSTTAASISKCYVRGDCAIVKTGWVANINDFINKL